MEIDELLKGKSYRRGTAVFPSTRELVEPFIEKFSDTDSIRIKVERPKEGTIEDDVVDETYTRVLIEALLPHKYNNRQRIIGLLYGLDVQTPVMKIYSGWENQACLNLSVFNPKNIKTTHFNSTSFYEIYDNIIPFIEETENDMIALQEALDFLESTTYKDDSLKHVLGSLAQKCLTSSGLSSPYVNMVNFISSPKDRNGVRNIYHKSDGEYSSLDLYEAMTCTPSAKSLDKSDDVLKIYGLFK